MLTLNYSCNIFIKGDLIMEDLYDFKSTVLTSEVELSEIDKTIFKNFDFDFDGKN
jgi:hypothetical protein